MSNGQPALLVDAADSRNVVAYAAEADPASGVDDCWEAKNAAFGGDDGVVFLELRFAEGLIARGGRGRVCMELTPHQVEAVTPAVPRPATLLASSAPRRRTSPRRAGRA